jgi:hypothetical protein
MGRLVKIGFPCHIVTIRLGPNAYARRITTSRTFGHDIVRLLYGFLGRTLFSLHCSPILRLLRLLETT